MADEAETDQGSETEETAQSAAGETPEEYDKERALATIRNLRRYEKRAQSLERELAAMKKQQAEANMGEIEKVSTRLAEQERRALEAESRIAAAEIRADFTEKALAEGVTDVKLAYLAAQADGLLGAYDDGVVSSHDFKELKKRYPQLFRSGIGSADGGEATKGAAVTGRNMNAFIRAAAGRR